MRLGAYPCLVKEGTLLAEIYKDVMKDGMISERHRHRISSSACSSIRSSRAGRTNRIRCSRRSLKLPPKPADHSFV